MSSVSSTFGTSGAQPDAPYLNTRKRQKREWEEKKTPAEKTSPDLKRVKEGELQFEADLIQKKVSSQFVIPKITSVKLVSGDDTRGTLQEVEINSHALAGNKQRTRTKRSFYVYLPPGYRSQSAKRFPVLYLLHGSGTTHRLWMGRGYLRNIDITKILYKLISNKEILPFIVVMPNGGTKLKGCWYSDSQYTGKWETHIVREIVGCVDENYRTLISAESRAIAGHSMGGYGAMKLALKNPDTFGAVYSTSGILSLKTAFLEKPYRTKFLSASAAAWSSNQEVPWDEDGSNRVIDGMAWQEWKPHDPAKIASEFSQASSLVIKFDCGKKDQLYNANVKFRNSLKKRGISHEFTGFEGGHASHTVAILEQKILPFVSRKLKHH